MRVPGIDPRILWDYTRAERLSRERSSKALEKVAKEFGALFIHQLIRSMRKTLPGWSLVPKTLTSEIFTDLLDYEYAREWAQSNSFGLARLIVEQWRR